VGGSPDGIAGGCWVLCARSRLAATSAMDKYGGGEESEPVPLWSLWASAQRGQPRKWGSATT
jgi:hypothetical protein